MEVVKTQGSRGLGASHLHYLGNLRQDPFGNAPVQDEVHQGLGRRSPRWARKGPRSFFDPLTILAARRPLGFSPGEEWRRLSISPRL